MRNQSRFLILYLSVLVGAAAQLAHAQDTNQSQSVGQNDTSFEAVETNQLNQAELDQILAPIALYPDTLLSHILVASTYPLEVVQAARWRAKNEKMNEQQALDAVEDKNWDPSVKALIPFNDLLQRFSQDLEWLQALGDAFLLNEEQVLSSVQNLRQKAYAQGNLENSDYIEVSRDDGQIVIENTVKEVVYVPYYDTRVVYGNWWWGAYPPYYWHSPVHYVWSAGFYWSPSYYIRPSFYFGGFHWGNRHVVANYHYRNNAHNYPHGRRVVSVREYPRWSHNPEHRRGVRYDHQQNPNRFVNSEQKLSSKKHYQIDKQRVLNVEKLNNKDQLTRRNVMVNKKNADHQQASNESIRNRLRDKRDVTPLHNETSAKGRHSVNDKQRLINAATSEQRGKVLNHNQQQQNVRPNNSLPKSATPAVAKETPYIQNTNSSNSEKTKTYHYNGNNGDKNRGKSNSQRHSSSAKQNARQSKLSRSEHKR
ncbi:MAG: hypothetical protein ACI88A_000187 [Paraglaciecola sp.]|jgi:hypothetical protein